MAESKRIRLLMVHEDFGTSGGTLADALTKLLGAAGGMELSPEWVRSDGAGGCGGGACENSPSLGNKPDTDETIDAVWRSTCLKTPSGIFPGDVCLGWQENLCTGFDLAGGLGNHSIRRLSDGATINLGAGKRRIFLAGTDTSVIEAYARIDPVGPFTVTVKDGKGEGSGTVNVTPAGPYTKDQDITFTPVPNAGSIFDKWDITVQPCSGSIPTPTTSTANPLILKNGNWEVTPHWKPGGTVTVVKSGSGTGLVQSIDAGVVDNLIDCGADCSEPYARGSDVGMQIIPDAGSILSKVEMIQ